MELKHIDTLNITNTGKEKFSSELSFFKWGARTPTGLQYTTRRKQECMEMYDCMEYIITYTQL